MGPQEHTRRLVLRRRQSAMIFARGSWEMPDWTDNRDTRLNLMRGSQSHCASRGQQHGDARRYQLLPPPLSYRRDSLVNIGSNALVRSSSLIMTDFELTVVVPRSFSRFCTDLNDFRRDTTASARALDDFHESDERTGASTRPLLLLSAQAIFTPLRVWTGSRP